MNIDMIPEHLRHFPRFLPNDLEGLIFIYPNKFPKIVDEYEELVEKIATNPVAYRKYGDEMKRQLIIGFNQITEKFNNSEKSLKDAVMAEQELSKLFCFKFWPLNYLFADGPIHDFYVDIIKNLARVIVPMEDDVSQYEKTVEKTIKLLLKNRIIYTSAR